MAWFENFPYTNFHEMNLDWILLKMKDLAQRVEDIASGKIQIADPLQWSIASQYPAFTVVMDGGNAYLSMQPVPAGVDIGNTDYWQQIFNIDDVFNSLKESIAVADEGDSTVASEARSTGSLVWLNDKLYQVTAAISQGEQYSENNVAETSVEELLQGIVSSINTFNLAIQALENNKLDNRLRGKQIAIYGDSYAASPRGDLWIPILNAATGTTAHVSAQGSLSLPEIYTNCWDLYNADIYIIEAGLNDVSKNTTGNDFMSAMSTFCTAIRNVNSNAEIYFVSPPDIPFGNAHNYLYPQEFYRQCYWHLMTRYHFHVIDGLKWQELVYSDNVHPTDATAPLIGKYILASLLNYGDEWNCRNDWCKAGRNDAQILFLMINGTPYLYFQGLVFSNLASDGSGQVSVQQLGCNVQRARTAFLYKSGAVYENGFLDVEGAGTSASPTLIIAAFDGATAGESRTMGNGFEIRFVPMEWIKDF